MTGKAALGQVREEIGFGDQPWNANDFETREPLQPFAGFFEHRDTVRIRT